MYEKQFINKPLVAVIVLAYKGWHDTILCLESLLKSSYSSFSIVVVDNCSPDDSWVMIQDWAAGNRVIGSDGSVLSYLHEPPAPKPLDHCVLTQREAEQAELPSITPQITFIQAAENKGYSAGNNIGIRYVQRRRMYQYVWLLNNDTLVKPDTLPLLVQAMANAQPCTGIMGAKLLYYHQPTVIQCLGGATYNSWLAYIRQVGNGLPDSSVSDHAKPAIDFVCGASMFVSMRFIQEVGLLDEEYFLYFEEIDWSTRGKQMGWAIDYELKAIVFHKEGGTQTEEKRSDLVDYYYMRNRLLFTHKNLNKLHMAIIYITTLLILINRLLQKQFYKMRMIFYILVNFKHHYNTYLSYKRV